MRAPMPAAACAAGGGAAYADQRLAIYIVISKPKRRSV
ncbi:hypothetical protein BURMUCGD1_6229 [Burkholderia multivorans CGD1]|nr:hypothetical protein BURMUCGD1_6229 [Burkholderia multivorans CGD1]